MVNYSIVDVFDSEAKMKSKHMGSDFDHFLREEDMLAGAQAVAAKRTNKMSDLRKYVHDRKKRGQKLC